MFLASGLGAVLAGFARNTPVIFIAFVAFGVVMLLALACGELIIEAREAQGDNEVWYVSLALYVAVFLTIILNSAIPN